MKLGILFLALISLSQPFSVLATEAPKYPVNRITPLSRSVESVHVNVMQAKSPLWKLLPYLNNQTTGASCSVASAAVVLNAIRDFSKLGKETELFTEKTVIQCTKNKEWATRTGIGMNLGSKLFRSGIRGVTLDLLNKYMIQSIQGCLGISTWKVESFRPDENPQSYQAFLKALKAFQKSESNSQIIVNFDQGQLFQDKSVGHISPIGAYDETNDRVLVLDVDRTWYEPYWVSSRDLWDAMKTTDSETKQFRGYLRILNNG